MVQTTWKDSSPGTGSRLEYKCPVVACCGIGTRSWGGGAGGHSVSWQKLAAQAPWRHVSHHHWESADRQTAGMWRWRSGGEGERGKIRERQKERERETGRKHCVTSGACRFTVCPRLLSRQHAAYSNLHGQPTATFKYYQAICNIQQPLHSKVWIWAKCCEKKGISKVSLMLRREKNIIQVFYLGNNYEHKVKRECFV